MTPNLESQLLTPFSNMVLGSQNVTILDSTQDQTIVDNIKRQMGPQFIFPKAMCWSFVETTQNFKHQADALVTSGEYRLATIKYPTI